MANLSELRKAHVFPILCLLDCEMFGQPLSKLRLNPFF